MIIISREEDFRMPSRTKIWSTGSHHHNCRYSALWPARAAIILGGGGGGTIDVNIPWLMHRPASPETAGHRQPHRSKSYEKNKQRRKSSQSMIL